MSVKRKLFGILPRRRWIRCVLLLLLGISSIVGGIMVLGCREIGVSPTGDRLERMKKSPHYLEDRFVNPVPSREPPILKSLWKFLQGADHTKPGEPVPIVKRTKDDFSTLPASGLRITWLGHSTTLVEVDGRRLLLDPVWSNRASLFSYLGPKRFFPPPLAMDNLPPIDAVLITHDHYDHLDKNSVEALSRTGTRFVVPLGLGAYLEYWGVPSQQITELDWWDRVQLDSVTVIATPARHFSGRSPLMTDRDETLWCGFAILGPRHRVYYSGDSGMFNGFRAIGNKLGPFDACLLEVGAYNELWPDLHLGPEQAVEVVKLMKGRLLIPVHWGTFDLGMHAWTEPVERVLVAARRDGVRVVVPQPGQSVEPSKHLVLTRWWPELPWLSAEDNPIVSSGLKKDGQVSGKQGY